MNFGSLTQVFEFSFGQMRLFRAKLALYNFELNETKWLESLHIGEHLIKISELDSIPIAPSNSRNLPQVQTGLKQGSPEGPSYKAYNSNSTHANEMGLIVNESCSVIFNMI